MQHGRRNLVGPPGQMKPRGRPGLHQKTRFVPKNARTDERIRVMRLMRRSNCAPTFAAIQSTNPAEPGSTWRRVWFSGLFLAAILAFAVSSPALAGSASIITCSDLLKRCVAGVDRMEAALSRSPGLQRPQTGDSKISRQRCNTDFQTSSTSGYWPGVKGAPGLKCVP